ncbi:MAG: PAS domain S-box protein [Syntrophobacteraceae bacterium]|jgi:PAS domain S-box-containing protein
MEILIQTQIFYEIAMSIGNSLDLGDMLKEGLSAYLRKLNCSKGIVFEMRQEADGALHFAPIFSIPRNLSLSTCQAPLERIPQELSPASLSGFLETLPISGHEDKGRFFHLMELPGFGLLLLVRSGKDLSPDIIRSLGPLNRKLADSCLACLQNLKIETINHRLTLEIFERRQAEAELKKVLSELELRVEDRTREIKGSNEALATVNQQLNDIIEFLPDPTLVTGSDGKVIAWNRAIEEMTGVPKQDVIGRGDYACMVPFYGERRPHLLDLLDKCDEELEARYKDLKRKGVVLTAETYVPCVYGGKGAYVFAAAAPLFDAQGGRTGSIESIRDITERKQGEEALKRSEEKYRELVENANSIILRMDKTGNVTFFNEFAQRFFGYSEQEILGKNVVGTIVPRVESTSGRHLMWMIEDIGGDPGRQAANVNENMRRNGDRVWIAWTNKPIFDESGELVEVLCIGNDITERERAQDELFNSRQMLQSILDNIPQGVFWEDRNAILLGCNKAFALDRGYEDPGELIGRSTYETYSSAAIADLYRADDLEVLQTGRAKLKYEEPHIKADGSRGWLITSKTPMFDRDGRVIGILGTYEDITEQKLAREKLRESEARYRTVIENMKDVFYRTDERGAIVMFSPSAAALLGYDTIDDMRGEPVESFWMYPEERARMLRALREDGVVRDYEVTLKKKDGTPLYVSVTSSFRKDDQGNILGVDGVIRDITERKRAEEERIRLVTAIEQAAEAIIISDSNWIIDYVNPAFTAMAGYDGTEAIGRHSRIIRSDKHDRAFFRDMRDTLAGGQVWSGRITNKRKDGSLYETETTISPVRNKSGAVINYVSIHRDITRQVKLERDLRQAQKMEAIGTLAGGIAHDFNNILTAIVGYAEIARFTLAQADPVRRNLDQVLNASTRATELVKRILAFSRQTEQKHQPVPIVSVVKEALKLLRPSLPTTIEIRNEILLSLEEGVIFADPTEIHQVLMNLCTNAAHAMRANGGVLLVRLSCTLVHDSQNPLYPDLEPGPYVCVSISDTGHGIDPAVMERIFDPYFTTKSIGEGTGLGLSVVQGIVRTYGGAITVHSEPGEGTTFEVFLRSMEKQTPTGTEAGQALPVGAERILFVDDEAILAELGKELLESLGYKVVAKTNSLEALETFRADPHGFDLVITDMTMPSLRGEELAREIIALRPGMPIILCTGYSELINETQAREMGIREFVMKPYMVANFAETIRKSLNTR